MGFLDVVKGGLGIASAVKGVSDSQYMKKQAEERAKALKKYAKEEFVFNVGESGRVLMHNMGEIYRQGAKNMYAITQETMKVEANALAEAYGNNSDITYTSYADDVSTQIQNTQKIMISNTIDDINFGAENMYQNYMSDIENLKIQKDKMENDINIGLSTAKRNAQNVLINGITTGVGAVSDTWLGGL